MSDREAILFANDTFYAAFAGGSIKQMRAAWADDRDITCIHPGWRPLIGQKDVMDSWATILSTGETADIRCVGARAFSHGDTAYITGFERMPGTLLTATNVFVRAGAVWRMVHHQAGPCQDRGAADREDTDPTLQ
ncbi:MAG: nuclear transport factor 2 family protein [Rhodospirillales bacterium]